MTINPPRLPFTPLYDRILELPATGVGFDGQRINHLALAREGIESAPRFICDDIAAWASENEYAGERASITAEKQTGPLMLPFDKMWLEWADPDHSVTRYGAFLINAALSGNDLRTTFGPEAAHGFFIFPMGTTVSGQVTSLFGVEAYVVVDAEGNEIKQGIKIAPGAADDAIDEQFILDATAMLIVRHVTAAIGMMNCKNVRTATHTRPAKSSKKQRRARKPGLSYSVIQLPGHTYDRNGFVASNGSGGANVSAHTVRGHMATFTADAPRFGRAADGVGSFWINPHVRGSRDVGQVQQLYVVAPPQNAGETDMAQGMV